MIVKKNNIIEFLSILLLIFSAFVFSSSITLFVEGGARIQGLDNSEVQNKLFINNIYLFIFVLVFCFISILKNKIFIIGFFRSSAFKLLFLFLCITILQLIVGIDFRQNMISNLLIMVMMCYSCWLAFYFVETKLIFCSLNFFYFFMFLLSFFLIFVIPSYGVSFGEDFWQGAFNHKNMLGIFCSSYILVAIISFNFQRKFTVLNIFLAMILCFGSGSYTSLSTMILIFILIIFYKYLYKFFSTISYFLIFLSIFISWILVYLSISGVNLPIFDKDFTFSGRNEIWLYSLVKIFQSPVLGYGYGGLGYQNSINSSAFFNATGQVLGSNHNGFIGLLYNYGVLGLFVFLYFIFKYYLKSNLIKFDAKYSFFISGFVLLNTFEDRSFSIYMTFFILIVYFNYIDRKLIENK